MSRQTIGEDMLTQLDESPIDLLTFSTAKIREDVPNPKARTPSNPVQEKEMKRTAPQDASSIEPQVSLSKERMTVQINKDTIERVKDCVYWERMTVAQFVEDALAEALNKFETQRGEPYQKRRSELKPGRPTKN